MSGRAPTPDPVTSTPDTRWRRNPSRTRPGVLRLGLERGRLDTRAFFRNRPAVVFGFAMPIVMMLLLASVFGNSRVGGTTADLSQVYVTGMIGVGIIATSLQTLALSVAAERANGTLKRLRATPMPPAAYVIGKVLMVLAASLGQTAVLVGAGSAFFGVRLPHDPGRWLTFTWVYLLGATAGTLLGLALSTLVRGENGGGVVALPFMVLQFISGVFVVFSELPTSLRTTASFFPLKWICQGMRSVFLPDSYVAVEPAGSWEHGRTALVLAVWAVVGFGVCVRWFRWKGENDG